MSLAAWQVAFAVIVFVAMRRTFVQPMFGGLAIGPIIWGFRLEARLPGVEPGPALMRVVPVGALLFVVAGLLSGSPWLAAFAVVYAILTAGGAAVGYAFRMFF